LKKQEQICKVKKTGANMLLELKTSAVIQLFLLFIDLAISLPNYFTVYFINSRKVKAWDI